MPTAKLEHQPHLAGRLQALQHLLVQLFAILKEVINRTLFTVAGDPRAGSGL
jgi:hypothetical protein